MKAKPLLLISDNFYKQAEYLCKEINTVEWSGIGIYKITGSITSLFDNKEEVSKEEFFIEALDIIPMDKGSSIHTDYKFGPEVQKYMKNLAEERKVKASEYYTLRLLHVHSHNSMNVFFSNTDNEELEDNVFNHNGYLSIITNNKKEYNAKFVVGCNLNRKMEGSFVDVDGKSIPINRAEEPKQTMLVFTPKIIFENQQTSFDKTFLNSIEKIKIESIHAIQNDNNRNHRIKQFDNSIHIQPDLFDQHYLNPKHNIQVSGNLKQTILNKISTTENAFFNFIKDALVNAFTPYSNVNIAINYSLTRILTDINKYYKNNTVDRDEFKSNLCICLFSSYFDFVNEIINNEDQAIYVNDLIQLMSFINSKNNKKDFPIATQLIEDACNNIIQENIKLQKIC